MKSDTPVDYALLQLSPNRLHCELIVSQNGDVERVSSGLVKSFTPHLKDAEEKLVLSGQSIELRVDKRAKGGGAWFTKRTLERFARFVNAPEILEQINTYDAELSQLEAALKIYREGLGDQSKNASGYDGAGSKSAADATKRELIRAIDVRLIAVKQDIAAACLRAAAAGFDSDTISNLQFFAHHFGSPRLKETCENLTTLWERRPDLVKQTWLKKKTAAADNDRAVRSSTCSDMSIEEDPTDQDDNNPSSGSHHVLSKIQETEQSVKNVSSLSLSSGSASIQTSQPSRRLSVQDRINLFENKQKETSSGGKAASSPALEKTVLRRLSSDVSSSSGTDKAVLRRWSGVSDMSLSVDLSCDKSLESPVCTPSPVEVSVDKFPRELEVANSESVERKDRDSDVGLKDQMKTKKEEFELKRQEFFQEKQNVSLADGGKDVPGVRKATFVDSKSGQEIMKGMVSNRDEGNRFESQIGNFQSKIRDSFVPHNNLKPIVQQSESCAEFPVASCKDVKREASPPRHASFGGQVEVIEKRVVVSTTKVSCGVEDSDSDNRRILFPDEGSTRDHQDKKHTRKTGSSSKQASEAQDGIASTASTSLDQVQRVRQSKGNQELNDELQLKANELEKLYAEHKLNVPGDQSASARRNKPSETKAEHAANSRQKNVELASAIAPKTNLLVESVGSSSTSVKSNSINSSLGKALKDLPEVAAPDSSKGSSYIRYMQKRDAKLREEWDINRAEKEAKMKAMLESLERSSSEMRAKFSGSMDRNDSVPSARQHMDKFQSFNVRSLARREQPVDDFENEEVDAEFDAREQKSYAVQKLTYEDSMPDAVSRNYQTKKLNRNISSSTPRTPGVPVSRSAVKANNLVSVKRKTQPENLLAQSVPNFADFRNENSKPSGTTAKTTTRSQPRNFARSRSSAEEAAGKEEKARRSQALRKSYGNPVEFKDLSGLNPDNDVLVSNKVPNKLESKTFLRKGNGIGPGAGANFAKMKTSTPSEVLKIEEESCELVGENEDYAEMIKEEVEDFDTKTEEYNDMESEQATVKQENGNFSDPGSGNDESVSAAELPATEPAIFRAVGSVQESPNESPLSWNARMNQSFSYPQESSDVEASVDSPMGSPASWNSHSMTQSEAEAVRMRKKWGSAQKPFVPNSSIGQSRKDMTKGFKRLLKFGRKSRGTETLVDWISATTSEGDDDTEDGRDPASRSSDDLRKSRMGFTPSHPSDDAYNESELYTDQVQSITAPNFKFREDHLSGSSLKAPRSFFSLSSFRSKGSESKPR